jgi:molecular chaperone DnaK (HSP70)
VGLKRRLSLAAKYIVGIDLGTTNSALARCDATAAEEERRIEVRSIPQLVNPNEVAERTLLPSFLYIPGEFDFPKGSLALPWEPEPKFVIGELARKRGAESPNRLVASAKSWLSYAAVNRTAPILPWQAPEEVPKLSPVEASSQFLQYLRTVWDSGEAGEQGELALAEQDVLLTVPASFDEEARELTRRAAEQAGYPHVTLLEEPQAAFYAWLESQGDAWRRRIKVGDLVLVCDVGGGTTDLSLIMVSEENGELTLKRVAVGDHILLGGDNMDLALARVLQQRLEASGNRIDTWQLHGLWHQCRIERKSCSNRPRRRIAQSRCWARGRSSSAAPSRRNWRAKTSTRFWSKDSSPRSRAANYLRGNAVLAFRSWACRMRPIQPSPSTSRGFCRSKFATVPRRRASGAAAADWHVPRTSCSTAE